MAGMNLSPRIVTVGFAVTAFAIVAGCGSDDDPSQTARSSTDSTSPADTDAADDQKIGTTLDIFGKAASSAVGSIGGYQVDGTRIVFDSTSIDKAAGASHCIILTTAAGGVSLPSDTTIVVNYSDGSQTCDMNG